MLMDIVRAGARGHGRARRGVAATEFALIAPLLILFVIGVFDISKAMILYQEVYNSAHTIALSASSLAVPPQTQPCVYTTFQVPTCLSLAQTQQAMSAVYAEIPWIRSGIEQGTRSVTLSAITFVPPAKSCNSATPNCYTANLAWSVPYADANASGFTQVLRPCGTVTQTTPTGGKSGDLTSVRTLDIPDPDPILVADVHYRYTPLFFNFITGPIDFWSSAYWPVRNVTPGTALYQQWTRFDQANQLGGAGKCAGYTQ